MIWCFNGKFDPIIIVLLRLCDARLRSSVLLHGLAPAVSWAYTLTVTDGTRTIHNLPLTSLFTSVPLVVCGDTRVWTTCPRLLRSSARPSRTQQHSVRCQHAIHNLLHNTSQQSNSNKLKSVLWAVVQNCQNELTAIWDDDSEGDDVWKHVNDDSLRTIVPVLKAIIRNLFRGRGCFPRTSIFFLPFFSPLFLFIFRLFSQPRMTPQIQQRDLGVLLAPPPAGNAVLVYLEPMERVWWLQACKCSISVKQNIKNGSKCGCFLMYLCYRVVACWILRDTIFIFFTLTPKTPC